MHSKDDEIADHVMSVLGILPAASIAQEQFLAAASPGDEMRSASERIVSVLRERLYGAATWQNGRLAPAIAEFICYWTQARPDRPINVVTTNYDDYLLEALRRARALYEGAGLSNIRKSRVTYPTTNDPLLDGAVDYKPWVTDGLDPEVTSCVYLHGRVPRRMDKKYRCPVVSESDYFRTQQISRNALTRLMADTDVILVGSSISDAPLLDALRNTKDSARRWAIVPAQRAPIGVSSQDLDRLVRMRMASLGIEPIVLDNFAQSAELFQELRYCLSMRSPKYYVRENYRVGRASRMTAWWDSWRSSTRGKGLRQRLDSSHRVLAEAIPHFKALLGAPSDEVLKVDVHLRWLENGASLLKLWATSTGRWTGLDVMPELSMELSDNVIVKTFLSGRPEYVSQVSQRWRDTVAIPLWIYDDTMRTEMLVGVATLSSMRRFEQGAIDPLTNSSRLQRALEILNAIGTALALANSEREVSLRQILVN
ncbi:SIR2 family protein [Microlunatus aurantiacus]|uniref:SIR2 family protein n=1 Tax=Microlunatus aurantiacus TaxID=446786 RepID=UPI0031E0AB66